MKKIILILFFFLFQNQSFASNKDNIINNLKKIQNISFDFIQTIDGKDELYATSGGYADIKKENVSLVLETAENAKDINVKRAEDSINRATKYLEDSDKDLYRAKKAIERAKIRISVAKKFN